MSSASFILKAIMLMLRGGDVLPRVPDKCGIICGLMHDQTRGTCVCVDTDCGTVQQPCVLKRTGFSQDTGLSLYVLPGHGWS